MTRHGVSHEACDGGYLRRSVAVARDASTVSLSYAFWTLDLPAVWVKQTPGFDDLLRGVIPARELTDERPEVRNLLYLMEAQGCLSFPGDRETYSLREVRTLFRRLSGAWYAQYYAHPLWGRLREGSLSTNGLLAWLIYNYHLSRSAAMSASRSAARLPRRELRTVFAASALEEYSHCEDYFFVRHDNLPVADIEVRRTVRLPSNLAFDEQMLRMAEDDWLAHVLAGLFQEATASYYEQCVDFYRAVDTEYRLPGFFRNWERHVELDLSQGHADDFAAVLDSDERCSRDQLVCALKHAWLTFQCLLGGLDDIVSSDRPDERVLLRMPVEKGLLDPAVSALVEPYAAVLGAGSTRVVGRTAGELAVRLEQLGVTLAPLGPAENGQVEPPAEDIAFLRADIASSIFRCLSHATEHDEILLLGGLADRALRLVGQDIEPPLESSRLPLSHHAVAIANLLRERATRPLEFAYLLRHVCQLAAITSGRSPSPSWVALDDASVEDITTFLAEHEIEQSEVDRLINLTLQLNELHTCWRVRGGQARHVDFFRD